MCQGPTRVLFAVPTDWQCLGALQSDPCILLRDRLDDIGRSIGRAIVHHDHFEAHAGACENAFHRWSNSIFFIPRWNQNRKSGQV
jgi:hypothetical protein